MFYFSLYPQLLGVRNNEILALPGPGVMLKYVGQKIVDWTALWRFKARRRIWQCHQPALLTM